MLIAHERYATFTCHILITCCNTYYPGNTLYIHACMHLVLEYGRNKNINYFYLQYENCMGICIHVTAITIARLNNHVFFCCTCGICSGHEAETASHTSFGALYWKHFSLTPVRSIRQPTNRAFLSLSCSMVITEQNTYSTYTRTYTCIHTYMTLMNQGYI